MNIHTTSSDPSMSDGPRGRFGRNVLAATAAAVVLAAVVGSLWLRSDSRESASPAVQAPAVAGGAVALPVAASHPSGQYTPHTIFIVGSAQQAATLAAHINDANVIRITESLPPLLDEVIVAGSDEAAAAIVAAETGANAILAAQYRVENRIVDLRQ